MPAVVASDADVSAAFPRRPRAGVVMGLRAGQIALTTAAVVLTTLAAFTPLVPPVAAGTVFGIAAGLLVLAGATVEDRPAYRWLATRTAHARRARRGDTAIARPLAVTPLTRARVDLAARIGREPGVLPGRLAAVEVIESDGIAYVWDRHQATVTAVIEVTSPEFLLRDPADRNARVAGWGRVLAAATRTGAIRQVQVLERSIPDDGTELAAWTDARLTDDPAFANVTTAYRELIGGLRGGADIHHTYLALTVDVSRIKATRGERAAAMVAAWRQEYAVIARLLPTAGLDGVRLLATGDLARVIRTGFDPGAALTTPAAAVISMADAGPTGGVEAWDHLRTDGAVHAMLWVAEWPRAHVAADVLWPLVFPDGVQRSLSLLYRPFTRPQSEQAIRAKHSEIVQSSWLKNKLGRIETLADGKELDDVLARERELLAGHGEVGLLGLVTITATTLDELDASIATVQAAATQSSVDLRRVYGQQLQAFAAAALPLGVLAVAQ